MHAPINPCNLICNMQLNVLNDLVEAMKVLDGKKTARVQASRHEAQTARNKPKRRKKQKGNDQKGASKQAQWRTAGKN